MSNGGFASFCRWCCCVYIVLLGILGGLLGLLMTVLGAILLWGVTIINNAASSTLNELNNALKEVAPDIDVLSLIKGVSQLTSSLAIFLLIFGIVVIVISCVGCWGACCAIAPCLFVYAGLVALVFVTQLVIIIMWFANRNTFKDVAKRSLESQVAKFEGIRGRNFESVFTNLMQIYIGCCGINNGSDYTNGMAPQWNKTYAVNASNGEIVVQLTYPVSCCKFNPGNFKLIDKYCPYNGSSNADVSNYNVGCYTKMLDQAEVAFRFDNFFFGLIGWTVLELLLVVGAVLIVLVSRRRSEPDGDEGYKMQNMHGY